MIRLWTGSAGSSQGGPAGWAFLLQATVGGEVYEREGSGGLLDGTGARAALIAVAEGLQAVRGESSVIELSCAEFVMAGFADWAARGRVTIADGEVGCPVCGATAPAVRLRACLRHDPARWMRPGIDPLPADDDVWERAGLAAGRHVVRFDATGDVRCDRAAHGARAAMLTKIEEGVAGWPMLPVRDLGTPGVGDAVVVCWGEARWTPGVLVDERVVVVSKGGLAFRWELPVGHRVYRFPGQPLEHLMCATMM